MKKLLLTIVASILCASFAFAQPLLKDRLSQIKRPSVVKQNADPEYKGQPYSKELEMAAKNGSSASQTELGLCYLFGNGIKVDNKKAQEWFEKAVVQNNADAMFWLGYMYDTNRAKKVKLASFFKKLGMEPSSIESLPTREEDAYRRAAIELYERATLLRQPDVLYMRYRKEHINNFLNLAAVNGSVKAKYDKGAQFLDEFYSSSLLDTTKLTLAKGWFEKALQYDHPNANAILQEINEMEMAIAKIKQEEEERLRLEAIARRDSIAKVEAERRRLQDSIDIATGEKLPYYNHYISDCNSFIIPPYVKDQVEHLEKSEFYRKLCAISNNSVIAYYNKPELKDGLDVEIYKQSDQYKLDLAEFQKKKNEKYALLINLHDYPWNPCVLFQTDGMTFSNPGYVYRLEYFDSYDSYIDFCRILFPIQPSTRAENYMLKFKTNDLQLLQRIRSHRQNLGILFIFKPLYSFTNDDKVLHVVNPLNAYLVDNETGETLADFSKLVRKTTAQAEKQRIENGIKAYKAKQKANAPKYHSIPKETTCIFCGGRGYVINGNDYNQTRHRCTNCYGRGYTMEHYY